MYFPIIRGRQYDLLALRELKNEGLLSRNIIPIIEPIKLSSTLLSIINLFKADSTPLIVVVNPRVGSFRSELDISPTIRTQFEAIIAEDNVIPAFHFNENAETELLAITTSFNIRLREMAVIHSDRRLIPDYFNLFEGEQPAYNVIPANNAFIRALRRSPNGGNRIGYSDKFNKLTRNADYLDRVNEFFSDDHIYFREEGYVGFSDYLTVGEDYNEGGFAPYAVAFHIVYLDSNDSLNVMHFVSDTNNDISDPANKFSEALNKFVNWYQSLDGQSMNTRAIDILFNHHQNGTYPGLPTLKKIAIMHHLELMGRYLDSRGEQAEVL